MAGTGQCLRSPRWRCNRVQSRTAPPIGRTDEIEAHLPGEAPGGGRSRRAATVIPDIGAPAFWRHLDSGGLLYPGLMVIKVQPRAPSRLDIAISQPAAARPFHVPSPVPASSSCDRRARVCSLLRRVRCEGAIRLGCGASTSPEVICSVDGPDRGHRPVSILTRLTRPGSPASSSHANARTLVDHHEIFVLPIVSGACIALGMLLC